MSKDPIRWASVGDTIEATVQNPSPATLSVKIETPESCAYANDLIAAGRWRVRIVDQQPTIDQIPVSR